MDRQPYSISTDVAYAPMELIDIRRLAARMLPWSNQTLCEVNGCVVRLGVIHGDFHWHKHDDEDEFFYVIAGRFVLEFEDDTVELGPGQGFVVPRGRLHFPHAPEPTVLLMVEGSGVTPTGD